MVVTVDAESSHRSDEDEIPTLPAWVTRTNRPQAPSRIGRFMVGERVGAGGAGEVFSAHDDTLQRPVALKLVRRGRVGAEQETRLLREARALAKLSHPNVVAVHDADRTDDFVYIAMELVEGGTLKDAFADATRGAAARTELLLQAARGLRAAHALGLVHRDFKPANALLGLDGRVRVADFGLARLAASDPEPGEDTPSEHLRADFSDLTVTGAILGTPAYMSPEQRLGLAVTAASDQFSFCVVAWQALYGVNPLAELDLAAWMRAEADIARPPPTQGISKRLESVLRKGLQPEAEDRHRSMLPVIAALEAELRPRGSRQHLALVLAASVGIGLGAWTLVAHDDDPCSRIALDWAALRSAALVAALDDGDDPRRAASRLAVTGLNEAAARWTADARAVCRAPGAADACLAQRRAALETAIELLERPTPAARASVPEIIATLDVPCRPGSPDGAPQDAELRRETARLRTRLAAGQSHAVADEAARLGERLGSASDPWSRGELLALRGTALVRAHDPQAALEALRLAYNDFERSGAIAEAAGVASELATVAVVDLDAPDRGRAWLRVAEQAADRLLDGDGEVRAQVAVARGRLAAASGQWPAAAAAFQGAAEQLDDADPTGTDASQAWSLTADAFERGGDCRQAMSAARRATQHTVRRYGELHPRTLASSERERDLRRRCEAAPL